MSPSAVDTRILLGRFSQISEPLTGPRDFILPSRAAGLEAKPAGAVVRPIAPEHAQTAQYEGPFAAGRAAVVEAVLAAGPGERAARHLDHAQFLIAHMMLAEARGIIRALPQELDGPDRDRAAGYLAIIARLGGGAPASLPPAWESDPLWPVVVGGHARDETGLRAAVQALAGQSRDIATAAVPTLVDVALAAGYTGPAAEILAAAPDGTDLEGTEVLDLLRGKLALAQGAEDLAFDTFARVAQGEGRAAAEARIALADVALERGNPEVLPEVSQLLQEGLPRWRGDEVALRLRARLARVAEDMGDIPTAVETMALILREHPGTPEARLAEERIDLMVKRLAEAVADPALPLVEALHHVRRLDPALLGRGDWLPVRMALAERLDAAGLGQAARAEYAATAASPTASPTVAIPAMLDALAVAQARLLVDLGDTSTARAVLDRRKSPRDPSQMEAIAALRLQTGGTSILPPALLGALNVEAASEIADPDVQLALAQVAIATGHTSEALAAYDRGLAVADETERLEASRGAAESGDTARATRYASGLTGERAELQRPVVASLAAPRRAGERLSVSGASALITAADDAGKAVAALLSEDGS